MRTFILAEFIRCAILLVLGLAQVAMALWLANKRAPNAPKLSPWIAWQIALNIGIGAWAAWLLWAHA